MIEIYTTGNARKSETQWIGAYAYSIYKDNKALTQYSCVITPATQNLSELLAFANAIHTAHNQYPNSKINVHTKSMYLIGGVEKCNSLNSNKDAWLLISKLYDTDTTTIRHISDASVTETETHKSRMKHIDRLAKQKLRMAYEQEAKGA